MWKQPLHINIVQHRNFIYSRLWAAFLGWRGLPRYSRNEETEASRGQVISEGCSASKGQRGLKLCLPILSHILSLISVFEMSTNKQTNKIPCILCEWKEFEFREKQYNPKSCPGSWVEAVGVISKAIRSWFLSQRVFLTFLTSGLKTLLLLFPEAKIFIRCFYFTL